MDTRINSINPNGSWVWFNRYIVILTDDKGNVWDVEKIKALGKVVCH